MICSLKTFLSHIVSYKMAGAGFIIYKRVDNENLFLTLEKFRKDRYGNQFDIPKGVIDEGETAFEAACRELYEEANIQGDQISIKLDKDFKMIVINPDGVDTMTLYLAEYIGKESDKIKVLPNPDTKKYEHKSIGWMLEEEAEENCLQYLKTIFRKAAKVVNEY